jgi:hypothetical protein
MASSVSRPETSPRSSLLSYALPVAFVVVVPDVRVVSV